MLINKDSRGWIIICLLILAASCVWYFALPGYGQRRLDGPSDHAFQRRDATLEFRDALSQVPVGISRACHA